MNVCRFLPWRRRAVRAEKRLRETRRELRRVHQAWGPLAHSLARIDREVELNDWTRTARSIFSGGEK